METQKNFFAEYTGKNGDTLVRLYADEGISGTKTKNRKELLRFMKNAESGLFEQVLVKDISRFARNTVDLLQNIRKLKSLGIETLFLTANMTNMGNSEFVLTIFGALAQEESSNTSKRIKFGKKVNAERGRVPHLVCGYDKAAGDSFHLSINEEEAAAFLTRAAKVLGMDTAATGSAPFADSGSMGVWFKDAVSFVHQINVMSGSGGSFLPTGTYAREKSYITIYRLFKAVTQK